MKYTKYILIKKKGIIMKGIATETIAKMLIVIIVVAIVVYIIYRYVVQSPLGEQECRAMMSTWCANCKLSEKEDGSSAGSGMSTKLKECVPKYGIATQQDDCNNAFKGETVCNGYIPQT